MSHQLATRYLVLLVLGRNFNMSRPSYIEVLPPDILKKLNELLADTRVCQLDVTREINAVLSARGIKKISRSSLNRYANKMNAGWQKIKRETSNCRNVDRKI